MCREAARALTLGELNMEVNEVKVIETNKLAILRLITVINLTNPPTKINVTDWSLDILLRQPLGPSQGRPEAPRRPRAPLLPE